MKLQLGELKEMVEALLPTLNEKLPVKAGYWLGRTYKEILSEFQTFEETRKKLIEKYAEKDGDGNLLTRSAQIEKEMKTLKENKELTPEESEKVKNLKMEADSLKEAGLDRFIIPDMKAFNAEFAELAKEEIEIKFDGIALEELGDAKIKGTDIMKLGKLIKEK